METFFYRTVFIIKNIIYIYKLYMKKNNIKETDDFLSKNYQSGGFEEEFYKKKYFKYKSKYSVLKIINSKQKGGEKPPTSLELSKITELKQLEKNINDHNKDIDYITKLKENLEKLEKSQIRWESIVKNNALYMIKLCEKIINKNEEDRRKQEEEKIRKEYEVINGKGSFTLSMEKKYMDFVIQITDLKNKFGLSDNSYGPQSTGEEYKKYSIMYDELIKNNKIEAERYTNELMIKKKKRRRRKNKKKNKRRRRRNKKNTRI